MTLLCAGSLEDTVHHYCSWLAVTFEALQGEEGAASPEHYAKEPD